MFRSAEVELKHEEKTDLLADITAIMPVWKRYREQLINAKLKNESDKFPLTETEKIYLLAYHKQVVCTFFKESGTTTKNPDEDVYLVIAESNDYARNGLSRSLFTLLEKMGCNTHHMMDKDYRAIYIQSETAKQKLQQLIITMLNIDIALPQLVESWQKYTGIRFDYDTDCIIILSDDKETRQQFCQDIEKIFGFAIELSEPSTRLSKTHSAILLPYIENIISVHGQNQELDDDTKKKMQAKKENTLQFLETIREKFHHNLATNKASRSQSRPG